MCLDLARHGQDMHRYAKGAKGHQDLDRAAVKQFCLAPAYAGEGLVYVADATCIFYCTYLFMS